MPARAAAPARRAVSWEEADGLAVRLCRRLGPGAAGRHAAICTASRGGLVPARLVADGTGIGRILVDPERLPAGSLFVDDIYDTGATWRAALSRADGPLAGAFLYARRGARLPPRAAYGALTRGAERVDFPWEAGEIRRAAAGRAPK